MEPARDLRNSKPFVPEETSSQGGQQPKIATTAYQKLELRRELENAHAIQYDISEVEGTPPTSEAFRCLIHIRNGKPIKGLGATGEDAREKAAASLLVELDTGTIIFNSRKALESRHTHENKFQKKGKKRH